jgi:hypothetical protein
VALDLVLVAEEEGPAVDAGADGVLEALGKEVVEGLDEDLIGVDSEALVQGHVGVVVLGVEDGGVEVGGEEAGFEARDAEQVVLGEGDAFDGEEFLRVLGRVDVDEVVAEAVNGVAVFDFEDVEVGAREGVLAGVLGGSGLPFRGAGAGGFLGVGAVGQGLFVGCHA